MGQLTRTDLQGLVGFLGSLAEATTEDEYLRTITHGVKVLISCEIAAYNEVDPAERRALFVADPDDAAFPGSEELFAEHMHEHPVLVHQSSSHDGRALRLSDFISHRQLHDTGLYQDFYRLIDVEFMAAGTWFPPRGELPLIALALFRTHRDFTERERDLLEAIRPHLAAAWRAVRAHDMAVSLLDVFPLCGRAIVVTGPGGIVRDASPGALELLRRYFGGVEGVLPEGLLARLRNAQDSGDGLAAREPVAVISGQRGRLRVRLVPGASDRPPLLLLDEEVTRIDPGSLRALGLSRRQAEVLALVAEGRTNAQVAEALYVSPHTVKKHLEGIFDRLGVRSRIAAASVALRSTARLPLDQAATAS